ncbi:MAG: zf-HC2 domain-containing protein [Deltaproteobacteria bacterium]|nr:zf-HC2 domain-containing protein [Deltaproteobacteria bacterium]MCW5803286.1 zf-HC2 domain-containing protein [Deltaproteobacteria bacterium]
MSLCQSIDTLAMAYLDDELVAEEHRELELHLLGCVSCKAHVENERAELSLVRKALVAPPAPDMLKMRIARALDQEDRDSARATRRRLGSWLLPGSAMIAAAASIAAFVAIKTAPVSHKDTGDAVATATIRTHNRSMPLEVQGASTGPWLAEHFRRVEPPRFATPGIQLLGARLTDVSGHEAALVHYKVVIGQNQFRLTTVIIDNLSSDDLAGGQALKVGDRTLHLFQQPDGAAVTYVDEQGMGYAFAAERLTPHELLQLVVTSDLIGRAQRGQ